MNKLRKFRVLSVLGVAVLMSGWTSAVFAVGLVPAIQSGADHILTIQNAEGSFRWPHGGSPGHASITGPIGMGLISAYGVTGDADHRTGATDAADFLLTKTSDWIGTYNPFFLLKTYDATGTIAYKNKATEFFDELTAGTYTRQSVDYNTTGYISLVEAGRSGSSINLRPWEFATLAYAAQREGSVAQATAFTTALTNGINTLDNTDPDNVWWDMLGLSGGVFGLGLTGTDFDPTAGSFVSASSTSDLADTLANLQNANGSWYWSSNLALPDSTDENSQTTAYAMLALMSVNTSGQYNSEIVAGRDYLLGTQLPSGGFPEFPTGGENIETEGEVVWALSESEPIPEPATVALLGIGLVGLAGAAVRRRRKQKGL